MRGEPFVVLLVCSVFAGCGGGDSSGTDNRIVRTGEPQAKTPEEVLTANPGPLSIADVDRLGKSSPAATAIGVYFWLQWGSIANAVACYDSSIRRAVGTAQISDALSAKRVELLASKPQAVDTARGRAGMTVTVKVLRKGLAPLHESFLLRRRGQRWFVVHDTLLERSLGELAGARAGKKGSRIVAQARATQAAQRATRAFRNLILR